MAPAISKETTVTLGLVISGIAALIIGTWSLATWRSDFQHDINDLRQTQQDTADDLRAEQAAISAKNQTALASISASIGELNDLLRAASEDRWSKETMARWARELFKLNGGGVQVPDPLDPFFTPLNP